MRKIKYILINDSMPASSRGKSSNICIDDFGHLELGTWNLELGTWNLEPREVERLNACSIGIKYNGSLKRETCDLKQRAKLINLLLELRNHFPDAKILGLTELLPETKNLKPVTRGNIIVSDAMNVLRRELSDWP